MCRISHEYVHDFVAPGEYPFTSGGLYLDNGVTPVGVTQRQGSRCLWQFLNQSGFPLILEALAGILLDSLCQTLCSI